MNNILTEICENKKKEIELAKKKCSFASLEKIFHDKTNRNFKKLLTNSQKEKKIIL